MHINNTKFISFEGGEGCGKSTQCKLLYEYLTSKNQKVVLTREIGGTKEAEQIRELMLYNDLLPKSELMLVLAARFEHLNKLIIPALDDNNWVICDRFIDSSAVYQGQYADIGIDAVYNIYKAIISDLMPNITFFIDIDPQTALKRAHLRGANNKFEAKPLMFHRNICKLFDEISTRFSGRIIKIDANDQDARSIHQKIIKHINLPVS